MENIHEHIKAFITRSFQHIDLSNDQDIFALGFINSLFALQLVLFVEREFGITVEDEDLDIEHFRTINALARLVESKLHIRAGREQGTA